MFTYSNIMRALKAGGVPDYWYAQFVVNDANAQTIGLAGRGVTVVSAGDVAYPVYLNTYNDAAQTAGMAKHWYKLNGYVNDSVGTSNGTNNGAILNSNYATFNFVTDQYISLPDATASFDSIECVTEFNGGASTFYLFNGGLYTNATKFNRLALGFINGNFRLIAHHNSDGQLRIDTGINVPVGSLIYVVIQNNGVETSIFLNGVPIYSILGTLSNSLSLESNSSRIGQWDNGNSSYDGDIYDLKLHSTALTPAQIKANALAIGLYGEQIANQDNVKVWHDKIGGSIYSKLTRYNYDDASQTAGTATHWYELNTDSNDSVGTAHGTNTDITYSNGGAVFNGTTSKIALPSSIYTAQWRTLEIVFELYAFDCLLFNLASSIAGNTFDIRITSSGSIRYRVSTAQLNESIGPSLRLNKKYYAVLTYNSTTGEILGYLDGRLAAQNTAITNGNHANGVSATIGMYSPLSNSFMNGTIYDLKLHSSPLTPAQIKANALAIGLYDGPIETEYTGITADLKPASYDPADTTLDTTSTIATNPDANDWQPYGA